MLTKGKEYSIGRIYGGFNQNMSPFRLLHSPPPLSCSQNDYLLEDCPLTYIYFFWFNFIKSVFEVLSILLVQRSIFVDEHGVNRAPHTYKLSFEHIWRCFVLFPTGD
jgi:hypothetical protein